MWGRRMAAATGWRDFTEAAAVAAVVCVLEAVVLTGTSEYRGFVAGVVAATTFWLVALRLLGASGRRQDPRDLTEQLVDGVPQWQAVHDLPLGGRTLDHVVVTPLAVLAVRSERWLDDSRREQATDDARRDARELARALARLGVEVPVWPAVVAWCPGHRAGSRRRRGGRGRRQLDGRLRDGRDRPAPRRAGARPAGAAAVGAR